MCLTLYRRGGKQRYEVYVCTKGILRYAHEVWRLLDPGHHLIPKSELCSRIISLPGEHVRPPANPACTPQRFAGLTCAAVPALR